LFFFFFDEEDGDLGVDAVTAVFGVVFFFFEEEEEGDCVLAFFLELTVFFLLLLLFALFVLAVAAVFVCDRVRSERLRAGTALTVALAADALAEPVGRHV